MGARREGGEWEDGYVGGIDVVTGIGAARRLSSAV